MKIAVVQMNPIIGAIEYNYEKIRDAIVEVEEDNVQLVIFPELALSGYPPQDLLFENGFLEKIELYIQKLKDIAKKTAVIFGAPTLSQNGRIHNSAILLYQGMISFYHKQLLPTYDIFNETRYFQPGNASSVWEIEGYKFGILICEDMWFTQHTSMYTHNPLDMYVGENIDLCINLSASPYTYDKLTSRIQSAQFAVKKLKAPLLFCNQTGAQDGILFDGRSMYVSEDGDIHILAEACREQTIIFTLPIKKAEMQDHNIDKDELLCDALIMGIRDYFTKQGHKKACLGLSGGIDSAVCVMLAVLALGAENVTALFLPSKFTSGMSREDVASISQGLNIPLCDLSIDPIFQQIERTLTPFFQKYTPDTTEENIQSRIRGLLLMAWSNKFGALLLNTSNKSESACGYCTLYGDSCGALAPLGDLLKYQVYKVGEILNKRLGGPIPNRVFTREPTAELRENQKDSDSLPPYDLLDALVEGLVVQNMAPFELAQKLHVDEQIVLDIQKKIYQNEYKRQQMPLTLKVSEKNLRLGRYLSIVHGYRSNIS